MLNALHRHRRGKSAPPLVVTSSLRGEAALHSRSLTKLFFNTTNFFFFSSVNADYIFDHELLNKQQTISIHPYND